MLAADTARRIDPDLAELHWRLMTTKGHHHKQALCAVANRMANRIFSVLKRGQPYVLRDRDGTGITVTEAREIIAECYTVPKPSGPDGAQTAAASPPEPAKTLALSVQDHVATALGVQAIEHHRKKVRFFSIVELVNMHEQEKAKGITGKIAESLMRADLVILDGSATKNHVGIDREHSSSGGSRSPTPPPMTARSSAPCSTQATPPAQSGLTPPTARRLTSRCAGSAA